MYHLIICRRCFCLWSTNSLVNKHADETEDEDANKEYVEETNRDAVMIAACKLVIIGAVPKVILFYISIIVVLISSGMIFNIF